MTEEPGVIIAIDPGVTTGIAWWLANSETTDHDIEQVERCDIEQGLRLLLFHVGSWLTEGFKQAWQAHLVVERFEFRQEDSQSRDKIDYTAAEVVGALRTLAIDRTNVTLIMQGAAQAKTFWTDDKIKKLALWVPGQRHAMDALRHLLAYRLFALGHRNLLEPFRPVQS